MLFNIPQLGWDLELLKISPLNGDGFYDIPLKLQQSNYSITLLRYWFIYHFLLAENANHEILQIFEIGSDAGQQRDFINTALRKGYPDVSLLVWDVPAERPATNRSSADENEERSELIKQSLGLKQAMSYDVIIVASVPGEAFFLEDIFASLVKAVKKNGILIGVSSPQRSRISKKPEPKISVRLIKRLASQYDLAVDFLSGGYFLRSKGLIPAQGKFRFRFNLLLGAFWPAKSAEIYWVLRK